MNSPQANALGFSTSPETSKLHSVFSTTGSVWTMPGCSTPQPSILGTQCCLGGSLSRGFSSLLLQNMALKKRIRWAEIKGFQGFYGATHDSLSWRSVNAQRRS